MRVDVEDAPVLVVPGTATSAFLAFEMAPFLDGCLNQRHRLAVRRADDNGNSFAVQAMKMGDVDRLRGDPFGEDEDAALRAGDSGRPCGSFRSAQLGTGSCLLRSSNARANSSSWTIGIPPYMPFR